MSGLGAPPAELVPLGFAPPVRGDKIWAPVMLGVEFTGQSTGKSGDFRDRRGPLPYTLRGELLLARGPQRVRIPRFLSFTRLCRLDLSVGARHETNKFMSVLQHVTNLCRRWVIKGGVDQSLNGLRDLPKRTLNLLVVRLGREILFSPTRGQNAGDDGESVLIKN